ncbi:MAG: glycosyltransferase [Burkholderiaceae bacterium]
MIPLAAVARALAEQGHEVQMVAGTTQEDAFFRRHGLRSLRGPVRHAPDQMVQIIKSFSPDITVCDWRDDFWLATRVRVPRCTVSIVRCEQFLGYRRRATQLTQKFPASATRESDWLSRQGARRIRSLRELLRADVMVVPSIPDLDPPPQRLADRYAGSRFVYTGPLSVGADGPLPAPLQRWIDKQARPLLLVTLGTAWGDHLWEPLGRHLRERGIAALLNIPREETRRRLAHLAGSHVRIVGFSPLLTLMRASDVVMHHCGHATALLALLAGKPAITVPTGDYDREDNAIRLEALGCSRRLRPQELARGIDIGAVVQHMHHSASIRRATRVMQQRVQRQMAEHGAQAALDAISERCLSRAHRPQSERR